MTTDDLYAEKTAASGSFEFDEAVAGVFPDMLRRSIPGYAATIRAIGALASRFVQPGTRCYDLGCSLGAATMAIRNNVSVPDCEIIAVDNSPAMIDRFRGRLTAEDRSDPVVTLLSDDIQDVPISQASLVVLNYTLQFLEPVARGDMINRIASGMVPGGVLVLSEKVVHEDETIDELLVDLHHDFKRRNHYSDLEISRKRAAIENVLIPDTVAEHFARLETAGFSHKGVWLRHFNFVSIVACK